MQWQTRLYARLTGYAPLMTGLTGGLHEGEKPQGAAFPCLTFNTITDVPIQSHSGISDLGWARLQFDALAKKPEQARGIISALLAGLKTFDLTQAPASPEPVLNVERYLVISKRSERWTNPEPIIYRELVDVKLWYRNN